MGADEILYIQNAVKSVLVAEHVIHYARELVRSTRPKEEGALDYCAQYLSFGAGPRASLALIMAAKAHALLQGQVYVACENVAAVAPSILRHRISPNFTAQSEGITADKIIQTVLATVPKHGAT